jgi:hypothetical protein
MKLREQHMQQQGPMKSGRRDFLLGLGRIAVVGGMVIAGYVLKKQRNVRSDLERCPNGRLCRSCALLGKCNLPAALTARQTAGGK